MAKFNDLKKTILTTVLSGNVPFVRGLHGIGKSEMMESVAEELGKIYNKDIVFHQIDMSHIKEGELTGMPITTKDPETGCMINTYTVYGLFNEVIKEAKEGCIPVIFFDEINRADRTVFQELMPIILNKRVQETYLPEETIILAAGNPEDVSEYKGASDDYAVLPMDPALKNRFFIFKLDVDDKEWLSWAIDSKSIHSDVIAYITEYPQNLHFLSNKEFNPTPRGWKKFSDAYTQALKGSNLDEAEDNIIRLGGGILGIDTTSNFVRFLRENKNPLLKVKDFFDVSDEVYNKNKEKLGKETPTRQYVTIKGITNYVISRIDPKPDGDGVMKEKKLTKKEEDALVKKFSELLWVLPNDILLGNIKEISETSKKLLTKIVAADPKQIINIQKYLS